MSKMDKAALHIGHAFGYLTDDEIALLQRVAASLPKGAVVVNIGAGVGTSALAVIEERNNLAKTFYTIDNREHHHFGGLQNERNAFKVAEMTQLLPQQIKGDSKQIGKEWKGASVDFLIIDGDHTYDGCHGDMKAWEPHLKEGALVAIHDYSDAYKFHTPEVFPAVNDRMKQTKKYKRIELVYTMLLLKYGENK